MGLFGKLKNILFEDDDEVEEMPVYTKEEVEEVKDEVVFEPVQAEEVKPVEASRLRNVKRDIDMTFEDDVLGEIPGAFDNVTPTVKEEVKEEIETKPVEEKKSIFPSFDEAEFERLNARINHNESKATQREVVRRVDVPVSEHNNSVNVRQANNNFSSTNVSNEPKDNDRYKINSGTIVSGKKPFTPSPVISPVYGILDKNYTKDDIVDRKGGLKREGNKPPVKKEKTIEEAEKSLPVEEEVVISVDSVRRKAYGEEIELPKEHRKKEEVVEEQKEKVVVPEIKKEKNSKPSEEVYKEVEEDNVPVKFEEPKEKENVIEEEIIKEVPSIEDQIEDEKFEVDENNEIDSVIEEVVPEVKAEKVEKKKMRVMDDLEKTSTLKILDDIEKELNSIKPISKEAEEEEDADIKEHEKSLDDTLENDLFNLIDSMYEEGDEEDD